MSAQRPFLEVAVVLRKEPIEGAKVHQALWYGACEHGIRECAVLIRTDSSVRFLAKVIASFAVTGSVWAKLSPGVEAKGIAADLA